MSDATMGLAPELRERVLARLGLPAPSPTFNALRVIYRAWCGAVPFDNLRKMTALRTGRPLPGLDAGDFFSAWLATGAGGTCWPGANALFTLLTSLGFTARRVAGAMRDRGIRNHGTVIVTVDNRDWLVDSSLLTKEPLPLGAPHIFHESPIWVEVEPDEGSDVVWIAMHDDTYLPCRVYHEPISYETLVANYERSRQQSPFNSRLFVRCERNGALRLLTGASLVELNGQGKVMRTLSEGETPGALEGGMGFSPALIADWVRSGALADSFAAAADAGPEGSPLVPPSRRASGATAG